MNLGTLIGLIGGAAMLVLSIYTSGGTIGTYIDIPSISCTIGGSYFALVVQYGFKDMTKIFSIMGRTFRFHDYGAMKIVDKLYEFAEKARREGILSLEEVIQDLDDKYLQQGLRLVVDGTDAEVIRGLMENELTKMNDRHAHWLKLLDAWSKIAPGFGMLGTVLGLIAMLKNLEDKSRVGPNMAVALITTFYGAIMANLIFQPMLGNLSDQDGEETTVREMIIEGVLSIQAGDNPRILLVKLASYLPPKQRLQALEKAKAD